jgi:formylglycine-generating enzyme required for sulfatase activity
MSYLSWEDLAAYLDWAGLRPMTELEFEKAARGPSSAVLRERAWGSTAETFATAVTNAGRVTEVPTNAGANINFDNRIAGPIRIGSFASRNYGGTSRENSGAGYYGVFELSGNLSERIITVGNTAGRAFTGLHGNGSLDSNGRADVSNWPANSTASGAGSRGGSYLDTGSEAQTSYRDFAASTDATRASNFGGRGVRTAP